MSRYRPARMYARPTAACQAGLWNVVAEGNVRDNCDHWSTVRSLPGQPLYMLTRMPLLATESKKSSADQAEEKLGKTTPRYESFSNSFKVSTRPSPQGRPPRGTRNRAGAACLHAREMTATG